MKSTGAGPSPWVRQMAQRLERYPQTPERNSVEVLQAVEQRLTPTDRVRLLEHSEQVDFPDFMPRAQALFATLQSFRNQEMSKPMEGDGPPDRAAETRLNRLCRVEMTALSLSQPPEERSHLFGHILPHEVELLPRDPKELQGERPVSSHRPDPDQTERFLDSMRPFVKGVHVVTPAFTEGQKPVLGGTPDPAALKAFPQVVKVLSPEDEALEWGVAQHPILGSRETYSAEEAAFLMADRHRDGSNLTVIELGPGPAVSLAYEMMEQAEHHFNLDTSEAFLVHGRDSNSTTIPVQGNTLAQPFQDGIADVVFSVSHPPFVSGSDDERLQALSEVHRTLKPGGEFGVLGFAEPSPAVKAYLDEHFERPESYPILNDQFHVFARKDGL